jgi:hypothetical protein
MVLLPARSHRERAVQLVGSQGFSGEPKRLLSLYLRKSPCKRRIAGSQAVSIRGSRASRAASSDENGCRRCTRTEKRSRICSRSSGLVFLSPTSPPEYAAPPSRLGETSGGAPIIRSSARWFIGNSTTTRRFSSPHNSMKSIRNSRVNVSSNICPPSTNSRNSRAGGLVNQCWCWRWRFDGCSIRAQPSRCGAQGIPAR